MWYHKISTRTKLHKEETPQLSLGNTSHCCSEVWSLWRLWQCSMSPGCKSCHLCQSMPFYSLFIDSTFRRKWYPCEFENGVGTTLLPFCIGNTRQPILGVQRGSTCYIVAAEQGKQVSRSFTLIGCHHYALPVNVMAENFRACIYIYGPPWTTQDPDGKLQFEKVDTFLKFNMEPENEPHHRSETEIWLGNHV